MIITITAPIEVTQVELNKLCHSVSTDSVNIDGKDMTYSEAYYAYRGSSVPMSIQSVAYKVMDYSRKLHKDNEFYFSKEGNPITISFNIIEWENFVEITQKIIEAVRESYSGQIA